MNISAILTAIYMIVLVFCAGILECFLSSIRYKFLQKNKKALCFSTAFIFNIIYIYILAMVLKNLNAFYIIIAYSVGYASGDVLAITFDNYLTKLAKLNGKKWNKKWKRWLRKKK